MAAANLTVTISGDASGLIGAVGEAQASLAALESSASALAGLDGTSIAFAVTAEDNATEVVSAAQSAISSMNGLEASATITAIDNTAAGVASAQASINSVQGKTVTITVNYRTTGSLPFFAKGTSDAPEGLAMVNDEKGVSDPRELIYHDGKYMLFSGRDVILPLSRGDRVYTAEQTKKILAGIPRYAKGMRNEKFESEKTEFTHLLKSGNVPIPTQIEWWQEAMERYARDSEVVAECNEEIFSLTRKLAENLNDLSKIYVSDRAYLNDFEGWGDTAIAAFDRVRDRNYEDLQSGLITWEEYTETLSDIGSQMYEERVKQSERWLKQESKYNKLSCEDYIAGLERMKTYTIQYYEHGIISYKEFSKNMQELSNAIADKENEIHDAVYEKWLSDAENWMDLRDTYDDWEDYGDSHVKFYERCIERIGELYEAGHISWQKYMDENMNYSMELYKAQIEEVDELLETQAEYISNKKAEFADEEKALKESWEVSDRSTDISELKYLIDIYKNSVTEKGKNKYKDLQEELTELQREERLYKLQKSNNEVIAALEEDYKAMESDKKQTLLTIRDCGIDINALIGGIRLETSGIQYLMTNLASKIINAINSKSTYSDNRSFNISAADDSALKHFTKQLEETIARGRYY